MERARIRRKRQQFQDQLEIKSNELRYVLAAQLSDNPQNAPLHTRLVLKLQYQLGELCAEYNEFELAIMYFQQVLTSLESSNQSGESSDVENKEMIALRINILNWLAVSHFRAGNQSEAFDYLLQAKKQSRDELYSSETSSPPVDKTLTVNYALFLHARGNVSDAESAAQLVVNEGEEDPVEQSENDMRARSTAFMLLASICKVRGKSEQALKYAEQAVVLADRVRDPRLISRAHNNLGIYYLEQNDAERAFSLFASAYRATQQTKDFEQQATVKYHLGLALSYLGRNLNGMQEIGDDEDEEHIRDEIQQRHEEKPNPSENDESKTFTTSAEVITEAAPVTTSPPIKTAKDLFLESENLTDALPGPDKSLRVLTQSCRGEEEYYAGEFHTAEAEFTIALGQLKEFTGIDIEDQIFNSKTGIDATATDSDAVNEETNETTLSPIEPELAKLYGLLLSYMGCTQLVEGKFPFAELSHKRDLALALRQEDLHTQHRALRNLAIVYNSTQRYVEAIPLWREALELAVVLDLKGEQLMAYSGLGSALRELLMLEGPNAVEAAGLNSGSEPMQPLLVFLKQRALAEEIGDVHQQILAQRHIVSAYESPISKPQSEGEATEALERRLSECDTLVRLCEKYENLQYRADAYRSLANALTSQLVRLRARANGDGNYGLADAIAVLTQKRNSICVSYEEASVALSTTAALMFQDVYEEGLDGEVESSKPKSEERHARPPLTRLEILQRR
ncbi:Hypothetical protein PHPALM_999 [Phytophthora palmivora]|uniref:Tetratricopeptide repeat protein n=1 Tax=Phytophthora palmivora TaxID=4796 RepID=A0A2P4YTG7_9STRA|nr:Hypothetical protein PHPALM_999 [Phytophthora palmivora]